MKRIVMVETHFIYDDDGASEDEVYAIMKRSFAPDSVKAKGGKNGNILFQNCYHNISFKEAESWLI